MNNEFKKELEEFITNKTNINRLKFYLNNRFYRITFYKSTEDVINEAYLNILNRIKDCSKYFDEDKNKNKIRIKNLMYKSCINVFLDTLRSKNYANNFKNTSQNEIFSENCDINKEKIDNVMNVRLKDEIDEIEYKKLFYEFIEYLQEDLKHNRKKYDIPKNQVENTVCSFVMRAEGFTYPEISSILDYNESTLRVNHSKVYKVMRKNLALKEYYLN